MLHTSSVFKKVKKRCIVKLDEVLESIPNDKKPIPNSVKALTEVEWRWRLLNIKGKIKVEISRKKPNEEREYIDSYGNWVKYNLNKSYDKYVMEKYYVYRTI